MFHGELRQKDELAAFRGAARPEGAKGLAPRPAELWPNPRTSVRSMHWSIRTCSKDWPRIAVLLRQKDELALFEGVAQPEGLAGPGKVQAL